VLIHILRTNIATVLDKTSSIVLKILFKLNCKKNKNRLNLLHRRTAI